MKRPAREPEYHVDGVRDLTHDGRGVADRKGKTVFVDGALPGETVRYRLRRKRRSFDEASVVDVIEASPQRVEPRCPYFGRCGGCRLQHLNDDGQLAMKQQALLEDLSRIGGIEPHTVLPPLQGDRWGYRRRARLGVKWVRKKDRVLVGFRELAKPYICDMTSCEILAPPVGQLLAPLAELVQGLSLRERLPQIEVAVGDNAAALTFRVLDEPTPEDLEKFERFGDERQLLIYLQPGGPDSVRPLRPDTPALYYALPDFDLRIEFQPTDFIQVNGDLNRLMVAHALDLLAPQADDRVLDLFSGLGNFALPLARRTASVTGVEGDAGLVDRARDNARSNGLGNVEYFVANLFETEQSRQWWTARYDLMLLDPPRAGAKEMVEACERFGARRIVYVSCHPGSLARDAGELVLRRGYALTAAGIMDMFPHTAHVESIAVFDRR